MLHWIAALVSGSLFYALADILCDEVISEVKDDGLAVETAADDVPDEAGTPTCTIPRARAPIVGATPGYRVLAQETPGVMELPATEGLSGPQDAAISGLVTTAGLALSAAYQLSRTPSISSLGTHLKWRPDTHFEFWFALLGGVCSFLHNFFLLKAFEHAPSTVLLPLIQVA